MPEIAIAISILSLHLLTRDLQIFHNAPLNFVLDLRVEQISQLKVDCLLLQENEYLIICSVSVYKVDKGNMRQLVLWVMFKYSDKIVCGYCLKTV